MEIFLLIFIVIIFGLIIIIKNGFQNNALKSFPYKRKDYLLTTAEKIFYNVLSQIAQENNYLLFAKVRLEDLLWLPKHTNNRQVLRNRIKSRHVDFLFCDKENIKPLLVIELDDASHNQENRAKRDNFIDKVLNNAGLPILRVKVKDFYSLNELIYQIEKLLKK